MRTTCHEVLNQSTLESEHSELLIKVGKLINEYSPEVSGSSFQTRRDEATKIIWG